MTRKEAISQQLTRYFTGIPCKAGHLSDRYTKNGGCVSCLHPQFTKATESMVKKEFIIHTYHMKNFESIVLMLSGFRDARVTAFDIGAMRKGKVMGGDVFRKTYTIFAEDEPALRKLCSAYPLKAHD